MVCLIYSKNDNPTLAGAPRAANQAPERARGQKQQTNDCDCVVLVLRERVLYLRFNMFIIVFRFLPSLARATQKLQTSCGAMPLRTPLLDQTY